MNTLLWIGTLLLAAFFLGLSVFNWRHFLAKTLEGDDQMSVVPGVGGLLGVAAAYLCPVDSVWTYWWVPLTVDFGSIPLLLWSAYKAAMRNE